MQHRYTLHQRLKSELKQKKNKSDIEKKVREGLWKGQPEKYQ